MAEYLVIQKRILHELGDWHVAALFTDIALWSKMYVSHQRNHNFEYPHGIEPDKGWCYRSAEDFERDWLLTRRPMERSRKALIESGYIEMKRVGIPARSWYRLTPKGAALAWPDKTELIDQIDQSKSDDMSSIDCTEQPINDGHGARVKANKVDCTRLYRTAKHTYRI